MQLSLTRTHRYFFGLAGTGDKPVRPPQDPEQVIITKAVQRALIAQLAAVSGGGYRSGPLYGFVSDAQLIITHATVGGYWPTPATGTEQVYRMDPGYMLGWNDALQTLLRNDPVEWVGQWVMFPAGRSGTPDEREELIQQAIKLGLVDQHHVLVLALLSEGGHPQSHVWAWTGETGERAEVT